MSKVGKQISDFKKTTPRHIQWVLLAAALVVVAVLAVLLVSDRRNKHAIEPDAFLDVVPELRFVPDAQIDWLNTNVGDVRNTSVEVYSNTPVQISSVVVRVEGEESEASDLSATATCTNDETVVTSDAPCVITLQYAPTHVTPRTNVGVALTWTDVRNAQQDTTPNAITAIISARDIVTPKPDLVVKPEPEPELYEPYADFQEDLNDVAPAISFAEPEPVATPKPRRNVFGNGCSDFAFPGYNTAGVQSGWIRPMGGAYYYHPFADINCETPTGIYNADTGYIMDISNPTKKIGSDAEHVRFVVQERLPQLSGGTARKGGSRARQLTDDELFSLEPQATDFTRGNGGSYNIGKSYRVNLKRLSRNEKAYLGSGESDGVFSSRPYDRTFVLRQYKPIPATIVSDIQADKEMLEGGLPVRATVDRNVYSDNGRTVIIPTGTLMLGYVTGKLPGPYKAVGRMEIEWYQFIRPDGVEFNFAGGDKNPFSADSQGRKGVPGHGSTDYLQQFVMPMLTAIVPAAVNLIAPISDAFVNQIDLDNNTVVQSGTVRSSELAKNEIITAWNNVATKLLVDVMDNTTPPFSIAAGTRITVFSPVDLFLTCGQDDGATVETKKCAFHQFGDDKRGIKNQKLEETEDMEELIGQVRSMMQSTLQDECCSCKDDGSCSADYNRSTVNPCNNYSFTTLDFYCRSFGTYTAINNAKQQAFFQNQQQQMAEKTPQGSVEYNTQVLGLKYNEDGSIQNPFKKESAAAPMTSSENSSVVTCDNGASPDSYGCCPGETYTDMGDQGFNCCPDAGGDCFPPIEF